MPHAPFDFHLQRLRLGLDTQTLSPAEVCARYVLLHLHQRHPRQWLSGPRKAVGAPSGVGLLSELEEIGVALTPKQSGRLVNLSNVADLYRRFFFRGLVLDSHEGLLGWLEGRLPLYLRAEIPTPDEMLAVQCQGQRIVTLILQADLQFQQHGRFADACDFLLHDFEHAHKFFGETHKGQVRFFCMLRDSLAYFSRWETDPLFIKDLNYLKSDMNSHPVHLIKYLKAVVLSAEIRKTQERWPALTDFWRGLFFQWKMDALTCESALRINHPASETTADLTSVSGFFAPPAQEIACGHAAIEAR